MATNTADLVGVGGKGSIAVGNAADLVVFAPDDTQTVDAAALQHRNRITPYDGRTLDGVVRATYLRGRRIDDQPQGALLSRTRK